MGSIELVRWFRKLMLGLESSFVQTGYSNKLINDYSAGTKGELKKLTWKFEVHRTSTTNLSTTGFRAMLGTKELDYKWLRVQGDAETDISKRLPAKRALAKLYGNLNLFNNRLSLVPKASVSVESKTFFFFSQRSGEIDKREDDTKTGEIQIIYSPKKNAFVLCSLFVDAGKNEFSVFENPDSLRARHLSDISRRYNTNGVKSGLLYSIRDLEIGLFYIHQSDELLFGDRMRNEKRASGEINGTLGFGTLRDSVRLSFSQRVVSVDDERERENSNARDLLTRGFKVETKFLPFPVIEIKADYFTHQVHNIYIYGNLVGENRWDKTYYLVTGYSLKFGAFKLTQELPITANYIIYDGDKGTNDSRNRLRRELKLKTELSRAHSIWGWRISYTHINEDYGMLLWKDEWVERLSWEHRGGIGSLNVDIQWGTINTTIILNSEFREEYKFSAYDKKEKILFVWRKEAGAKATFRLKDGFNTTLEARYHRDELEPGGAYAYPIFALVTEINF